MYRCHIVHLQHIAFMQCTLVHTQEYHQYHFDRFIYKYLEDELQPRWEHTYFTKQVDYKEGWLYYNISFMVLYDTHRETCIVMQQYCHTKYKMLEDSPHHMLVGYLPRDHILLDMLLLTDMDRPTLCQAHTLFDRYYNAMMQENSSCLLNNLAW